MESSHPGEAKYGRLRTSLAVHSMNLRAKIVPAVQHNYCGYLYRLVAARFMGDRSKMELPDLVVLLRDAIYVNALCCEDVFPTVVKSFNMVNEESKKEYVDVQLTKLILVGKSPLRLVDVIRLFQWLACRMQKVETELKYG